MVAKNLEQLFCMSADLKTFCCFMGALLIVTSGIDCSRKTGHRHNEENVMPKKSIAVVLKEHTDELMAISGVVGTAQGLCNNKPCIKVYVIELTPELKKKIPKNLEGYAVDIEVTGEIRALPKK
jgi:hypothetical protein